VLSPARIEIERGGIGDIAAGSIRNNGDVIPYLVVAGIAFVRIKRIAHSDVRRPGNAGVGAVGIE
jgi:hypothetical protein